LPARSRQRIAFITDGLLDVYQSELRKAFERAALRDGFDLVVVMGRGLGHVNPAERAQNAVYDWLTPEAVDGAVLLSGALMNFLGSASLEALVERLGAIPKVSIGVEMAKLPYVTVDNRAGMRASVEHLIRVHGCRRMVYLAGPSDNQESKARLEGYRYALEAHLLPFDPQLVEHGPFTLEGGIAAMQALIGRGRRFDAVVAANDPLAIGARQVLTAHGLAVPGGVRLIGFDDSPLAASARLSSVAQPFNQLALHALEALRGAMQGRSPHRIAFCPRLALRDSCGCGEAASLSDLPAVRVGQEVREYMATYRLQMAETLQVANAASFDWWSTRVERLLRSLESAVAGKEEQFLQTLDELAVEAFADGLPVEQIGRNVTRLQRHFQGAKAHGLSQAQLDGLWNRALTRLSAMLEDAERKKRIEMFERSVALRDASMNLWGAEDEAQLGRRLANEFAKLGVHRAYLGVVCGARRDRFQPLLQLETTGAMRCDGAPYDRRQLLPPGFPSGETPSTLLVASINFGSQVTGIWACDGGTDIFVFEQLRTELGAIFELFALRRALMTRDSAGVPPPRHITEPALPAAVVSGPAIDDDERTRKYQHRR
jgi:DNA-binding LacI/PurR family transcriptional regulator